MIALRRAAGDARRLLAAPAQVQGEVLHWALALVLVRCGRRALSMAALGKLIGVQVAGEGAPGDGPVRGLPLSRADVERSERYLRALLAYWPSSSPCLDAALAAGLVFRARQPHLKFSVARREAGIEAHAFLEVDGEVVDISPARTFVVLGRSSG